MTVQARNNGFGTYNYSEPADDKTVTFYRNGTSALTAWTQPLVGVHNCFRGPHTMSPAITWQGIANYRKPTAYRRWIYDATYVDGEEVWVNPNPGTSPTAIMKQVRTYRPAVAALNNLAWPNKYSAPDPNLAIPAISAMNAQAITKALNRLGDEKTNVSLSLAEARKSYDLMVSGSIRLIRALLAVKHGNLSLMARYLGLNSPGSLIRNYLEYTYGWKPLMSDIYGSYTLLKQALEGGPPVVKGRATIREFGSYTDVGSYTKRVKCQASVTVCVSGTISDQYKRFAVQAGIGNPAELAWELIPWSFVVDWFLPVGDLIRAMQARTGLTFVSGWNLGRVESETEIVIPPRSGWTVIKPASISTRGFSMNRSNYSDFPTPIPYIKSPFQSRNAWNALALAANLLGIR